MFRVRPVVTLFVFVGAPGILPAQTRALVRRAAAALATLLVTAGSLCAQQPFPPEFRVNTYTTGTQRFRSVTGSGGFPTYRFVVTWDSDGQDGSQYGVFAQRYDSDTPIGGEFRANTHTTADQRLSRVAYQPNGGFVVVWQSDGQDGDGAGVFGQRYSGDAVPLGGEFRVNTFTPSAQAYPDVTGLLGGGFLVVWESDGQDGSGSGIFARGYDADGVPLSGEFRVNTYTTGPQRAPRMDTYSNGDLIVVWEGYSADDELLGIRGQRYSVAGPPLGGEFRVNSYTTGNQRSPAVGLFGSVVVWQSDGQDGSGAGVFGQIDGFEFRVNTYTTSDQSSPDVTFSANGFMVLWQSDLQDGSAGGIYAQKFMFGGPAGPEFRLNSHTTGPQTGPAIAFASWPVWLSPWTSPQDPDGSLGVYALPWFDIPVELQTFVVE
jgi:hypothetical protein